MTAPEIALNALKPAEHVSRARAYRKTKTLNSLTPLNALNGLEGKGFKGFKEFHCLKASELLEKYRAAGVTFWLEGELVKWRGPSGVFTETDRQTFKELKPIVLSILKNETTQSTLAASQTGESEAAQSTLAPSPPLALVPPQETERERIERIRAMAAHVSPEELRVVRRRLSPSLHRSATGEEINELCLVQALLDKGIEPFSVLHGAPGGDATA